MKRWANSSVNAGVTSSFEMEITNKSDDQLPDDLFNNWNNYDLPNNKSSATNESRVLGGEKLVFWMVPVSLTILALLVVCVVVLRTEQRRRAVQRRDRSIRREFRMMHTNRPLRNMTPRARIPSAVRVAAEGKTLRPSFQIMLPTENARAFEVPEIDSQEAPKELLITELTLKVATVQDNNWSLEQPSGMVSLLAATGNSSGWETIKGKIIGKDIDEEKVSAEKTRGGCKSVYPCEASIGKAFNASG